MSYHIAQYRGKKIIFGLRACIMDVPKGQGLKTTARQASPKPLSSPRIHLASFVVGTVWPSKGNGVLDYDLHVVMTKIEHDLWEDVITCQLSVIRKSDLCK